MIETTLTGKTPDIGEENIKKLMTMFPEVVTEGKVDFEKLKQLLGEYVDDSNERYNFTWNGKGRALRLSQTPSLGTLRPCKEESKNWDTTQNLYIEGDNLEVLKLLQKSYYGKIKMIYIDPPYNTGKDFVYRDDFHDSLENYKRITGQVDGNGKAISTNTETSGRYHTDWLNMMYPRLRLARNLLRDDGVIFISIDDNEVHNLRKICDEVFGEENAIGPFIWPLPRGINAGLIARAHEYILVYTKNRNAIPYFFRINDNIEYSIERCNKRIDARHPESEITFPAGIRYEGEDKSFSGIIPGNERITIHGKMEFRDGKLVAPVTLSAGWTMKEMILSWLKGETVYDTKGQKIVEFFFKSNGKLYSKKEIKTFSIKSVLKDIPDTQVARTEVEELLGNDDIFPYPKTIELAKLFARLSTSDNDIILDFFSGSATTAHAVMQLNAEDGGNRKFIMVQLPEPTDENSEAYKAGYKNISEIGKERIRRAGEKIKEGYKDKENIENLDIGFKVFKLDTSNIRKWQPDYDNLEQSLMDYVDNFVEGRTEFDVVYEIMLKYGLDLTYPVDEFTIAGKKVYSIGYGMLMICLDNEITTEVAKGILTKIKELSPESSRVVFKDNGFKSDSNKTNIKEILKSGGIEEFITI